MKKRKPTAPRRLSHTPLAVENAPSPDDARVQGCFAIFSDDTPDGSRSRPIAIFDTLEDAMDWGLERFKGGSFRLRYEQFLLIENHQAEPLLTRAV